jgi:hypothetical protein
VSLILLIVFLYTTAVNISLYVAGNGKMNLEEYEKGSIFINIHVLSLFASGRP